MAWSNGDMIYTRDSTKPSMFHMVAQPVLRESYKNPVRSFLPKKEPNFLKLDCSKLKSTFGWKPKWNVETAMEKIVEWSVAYLREEDVSECMKRQIEEFLL